MQVVVYLLLQLVARLDRSTELYAVAARHKRIICCIKNAVNKIDAEHFAALFTANSWYLSSSTYRLLAFTMMTSTAAIKIAITRSKSY